jgi:hypothetical protein
LKNGAFIYLDPLGEKKHEKETMLRKWRYLSDYF